MPVVIVNELKAIQINKYQGQSVLLTLALKHPLTQAVGQQGTIGQTGQ